MLTVEVEWETAEWSRSAVQHGPTPFVNRLLSTERYDTRYREQPRRRLDPRDGLNEVSN